MTIILASLLMAQVSIAGDFAPAAEVLSHIAD